MSVISTVAGTGQRGCSSGGMKKATTQEIGALVLCVNQDDDVFFYNKGGRVLKLTQGVLELYGGNGVSGYSGDGGLAVDASFQGINGMCVDKNGNLILGDYCNHKIRKISPEGVVDLLAGNGAIGFSGDGPDATKFSINPVDVASSPVTGNIYVSDGSNHRIRMIKPTGEISTIAGTGKNCYSNGDGKAIDAQLNYPTGICVWNDGDGDEVAFADCINYRIRKINCSEGSIKTLAGTGIRGCGVDGTKAKKSKIGRVYRMAVDTQRNIYFTDYSFHIIRRVDTSGTIMTIAGSPGKKGFKGDGRSPRKSRLNEPGGIDVDSKGNIYFADIENNRIRKISLSGRRRRSMRRSSTSSINQDEGKSADMSPIPSLEGSSFLTAPPGTETHSPGPGGDTPGPGYGGNTPTPRGEGLHDLSDYGVQSLADLKKQLNTEKESFKQDLRSLQEDHERKVQQLADEYEVTVKQRAQSHNAISLLLEQEILQSMTSLELKRQKSEETWSCEQCTFINTGLDDSCSVCLSPKPVDNHIKKLTYRLEEATICQICMENPKDTILLPCAHFQYCSKCAGNLKKCATCGQQINVRQKVFT